MDVNRYDARLDRLRTADSVYGSYGPGFHDFVMTEMEVGARAALALDDPEQWFWELQFGGNPDFVHVSDGEA